MSKSKLSFVPPTVEEVAAYCRERNNGIDPLAFWSHYETVGWVYGKAQIPIKSWKACVITWERFSNSQRKPEPAKAVSPTREKFDPSTYFAQG